MYTEETVKPTRSRIQRHISILMWKSYLQRQRRWRLLLVETLFAAVLFLMAVFVAKPVFLTPLQVEERPPMTTNEILSYLHDKNILGYAPNISPYSTIMQRVSDVFQVEIMSATTEDELNDMLYNRSRGTPMNDPVIWIVWSPTNEDMWKFSIRSTERARYATRLDQTLRKNSYLRSGFLAVQLVVSKAILEYVSEHPPDYQISLRAMPVSPLMQESIVRRAITNILLCYTMALLPPVLETEALVVTETKHRFKRALRIRNVSFSTMYIGWLVYAYMTALPMCVLGSFTLILIFRWIHLLYTLILVFAYTSLMIMLALIMGMFHARAWIACIWTTLFTFLQTFLADLLVHHRVDVTHPVVTFILHIILPPLGLVHGFNEFALLQTGQSGSIRAEGHSSTSTLVSWIVMILIYFALLMILQRTLKARAIGGQVSWKSIIFKEMEDKNRLRRIDTPTGRERDQLQEVDELVAKAISFRNVSKVIMGGTVLDRITFDIYRGEYTMLYAERVQQRMITTVEDLLTGLTYPDYGTINILGENMEPGNNLMSKLYMTGYFHHSNFLVDDLTVEEHINLFLEICLWRESDQYVAEYGHVRRKKLLHECDLSSVQHEYIRNLDSYYRAQLCWAVAILLEPRVVIIPSFMDNSSFVAVIKDKIMQYKKYITIVKFSFASIKLEFADRVFLFDNKLLVFGGTPAYMFFKYGREYRVRMTFRHGTSVDEEVIEQLLDRAAEADATVRAHFGSLLILRLPASPTADAAALIKHLSDNAKHYGILSMNISLPDSEEVCKRAILQSRALKHETSATHDMSRTALREVADPTGTPWKRNISLLGNMHLRNILWKYCTFYYYYRFYMIVTVISAILAGVFIALSLSKLLSDMEKDQAANLLLNGQMLTVEALKQKTNLVLRLDGSDQAVSVANAYVMSETDATVNEIKNMGYTALLNNESITEYLATRAIDSPQKYVYLYAYGMDVFSHPNGTLHVQALYSPMHYDDGAVARSIARVHMALMRHYTGSLDATIQVKDDPLALDLTPWLRHAAAPPLMIQFLLILTISHITFIPSKEYGHIRHAQSYSVDFSPFSYWMSLYVCDIFLYWILVVVMTGAMLLLMFLIAPTHFEYMDLAIIPFTLTVYGIGCVPQAYLFSLSQWSALNSMTYVIVNILFGETTVVAKLLYGNALNYVLHFLSLSPQFNMAYAFVKIKKIFFYNSECTVFKSKKLCTSKTLHKCCNKCGVLQKCFSRKSFLTQNEGVVMEMNAILTTALVYTTLLLLWEYKVGQRLWTWIASNWIYTEKGVIEDGSIGVKQEKKDAKDKIADLRRGRRYKDSFGECLLASNVSYKRNGQYVIRDISFGIGKGEVLALSGLYHQERIQLCEILSGYRLPSDGELWAMSRWKLQRQPYMYASNISLCCEHDSLPHWMTVYDGLELIAALRGVPPKHLKKEVLKYIDALELRTVSRKYIITLRTNDRKRVNFAAAVIGAPPILVLDECTAYQKYSVRRAMYFIIYQLRKRGHAVYISSGRVESHMPVTNRLAILVDGFIFDIDDIDNLVERYSHKGYTVVVHLKNEVDVTRMFAKYFKSFTINDSNEVLVNIQVLDDNLNWGNIFEKMERLQAENHVVYSYVISAIPIDYIYNRIIINETGQTMVEKPKSLFFRYLLSHKSKVQPPKEKLDALRPFEKRYDITTLKELPWSVIFNQ